MEQKCEVCGKVAAMRCPTCRENGLAHVCFCGDECFKRAWPVHRLMHRSHEQTHADFSHNPAAGTGFGYALGLPVTLAFNSLPVLALVASSGVSYITTAMLVGSDLAESFKEASQRPRTPLHTDDEHTVPDCGTMAFTLVFEQRCIVEIECHVVEDPSLKRLVIGPADQDFIVERSLHGGPWKLTVKGVDTHIMPVPYRLPIGTSTIALTE